MKGRSVTLLVVAVLLMLSGGVASAVHVEPADYTASRRTPDFGGVDGRGEWDTDTISPPDLNISWEITPPGQTANGLWNYRYDITTQNENMTSWILEVSDTVTANTFEDFILNVQGSASTVEFGDWGPGPDRPYLTETLHGVQFSGLPGTSETWVAFDSPNDPVWGDFYAQSGTGGTAAFNDFIQSEPILGAGTYQGWIATVDSAVIPEPGLCFLGLGALFAGMFARKRTKNGDEEEEEASA